MKRCKNSSQDYSICAPCRQDKIEYLSEQVQIAAADDCVKPEDVLSQAMSHMRLQRLAATGIEFDQDRARIIDYLGDNDEVTRTCCGYHAYAVIQDDVVVGIQIHSYRDLPEGLRAVLLDKGYTLKDCPLDSIYMPGQTHAYRIIRTRV
ncbi:MAG: hypothetical protein AB7F21_07070 [Desulfuromonadales bacterium]